MKKTGFFLFENNPRIIFHPLRIQVAVIATLIVALNFSTGASASVNLLADAGDAIIAGDSSEFIAVESDSSPSENLPDIHSFDLNINECIERALSDNRNLELARQAVEIARAGGRSAVSSFLPDLRFAYIYTRLDDVSMIEIPGIGEFAMGSQDSFRLGLSFTFPIYTGGQYSATVRASDAQTASGETCVKQAEILIIAGVIGAYSYTLEASRALDVSRASKAHLDEVLRSAQASFDQGLLPLSDLLSIRVAQASAEQAVIQAERNHEIAQSSLAYLIGAEIGERWVLEPLDYPVNNVPFSLETLWEWALGQRQGLAEIRHNREALEAQMDAIKSGRRPRINFQADLSRSGDLPDGSSQGEVSGFGEGTSLSGTIGIYWDLYDFGRTGDMLAPLIEQIELLEIQEADLKEQIKREVESALLNVRNQYESIGIAESAIVQAEEAYRVAKRRHEEGLGLTLQVLDAEATLARTSLGFVHVTYEYYRGLASLAASIGISIDDLIVLITAVNDETEKS
ncbi:MAG TPA: TolC family protein [Firmicutes bacterium]|nr:TolC family protein [Bacillota bacterium]